MDQATRYAEARKSSGWKRVDDLSAIKDDGKEAGNESPEAEMARREKLRSLEQLKKAMEVVK